MPIFLLSAWEKVRGWCIAIGAVLLAVAAAVFMAFRKGSASATARIDASTERAVNDALVKQADVIEQTHTLPAGQAAKELDKSWSRD